MASFPPSRSSPPSTKQWTFDVFLSFRGADTRKNFTDHLYSALKDAGINTFWHDSELTRGQVMISTKLLAAIQESRISLIVFSKNYADSRCCLDELVKIMECRRTNQQLVLPIFYNVDPSDVRHQRGSFADAFDAHEINFREEIARWKAALTEAANLSGWDLSITSNGHEAKFIRKIVQKIMVELKYTYLHIAYHPVGLDSRLKRMNSLLRFGSNEVRMVGIWGLGGIGKTTIAKAVYNQFFHSFDGKCFLENVREISRQPGGLIRLQEQLISDILKIKKRKVGSVDRGINAIKATLSNRRVLVVLDDVDQLDQLNAIAREHDWFGMGSRIIITTRDEHLLKIIEADAIYQAEKLNDQESLELFSWHAFGKKDPVKEYAELSKEVISYSKGLPLALEVLGSFLCDKRIPEWKDALAKLERIPEHQILRKLRISIDAIEDDKLKSVFLDIAFFFIGEDMGDATKILDGCGLLTTTGIAVLTRRCLVKINADKTLAMHDMIRDVGREIVREESFKYPGKRSRLWFHEDVLNVLEKCSGTDATEGLSLNMPIPNEVSLQAEAFANMQNLRLVKLNHVRMLGDYEHISKELRWICWHGFPLKYIPNDFYQGNLIAIDMRYSNLRQVWKDTKVLEKLKVLNLGHSHFLTKTPNFLMLPNLEKLILKDCKRLVEIHQSIGSLKKLVLLEVKDCPYLKNLPRSISKLKSVEILDLSGCSTIDKLPEDIGEMESLITLLADATAIRQLPFSIVRLKNLKYISMCGCSGSSSSSLPSLIWSWLSPIKNPDSHSLSLTSLPGLVSLKRLHLKDCNLSQDAIPKGIGSLSSLEELDLSGNNFTSLPTSFNSLSNLWRLELGRCKRLQSLSELPASLKTLNASDCLSLEKLNLSNFIFSPDLIHLRNCNKLIEVPGLEKLKSGGFVRMEGCSSLSKTFKDTLLGLTLTFNDPHIQKQKWPARMDYDGIILPEKDIPHWFDFQSMGSSLSFQVPLKPECDISAFGFCIIFACANLNSNSWPSPTPVITVVNRTKNLHWSHTPIPWVIPFARHDQLCYNSLPLNIFENNFCRGDMVDVKAEIGEEVIVKKCGLQLVYEQAEKVTELDGDGEKVTKYYSASNLNSMVVVEDGMHVPAAQLGANRGKRGHEEDDDGVPNHEETGADQYPTMMGKRRKA